MSVERYQDINISDNIFKNEYSARYINSQYSSAYNILDNNSQLNSKKFVAEIINTISNILYHFSFLRFIDSQNSAGA